MEPMQLDLKVTEQQVKLPRAGLNIKKCTSVPTSAFMEPSPKAHRLRTLRIPLSFWIKRYVSIWMIQLGDINMLTWPGVRGTWINSMTNDHHAYFTDDDEYDNNTYDACFSVHGKYGATPILDSYRTLFEKQRQ